MGCICHSSQKMGGVLRGNSFQLAGQEASVHWQSDSISHVALITQQE